jgi:hypothetical protein
MNRWPARLLGILLLLTVCGALRIRAQATAEEKIVRQTVESYLHGYRQLQAGVSPGRKIVFCSQE